jgi:hypothetical protein
VPFTGGPVPHGLGLPGSRSRRYPRAGRVADPVNGEGAFGAALCPRIAAAEAIGRLGYHAPTTHFARAGDQRAETRRGGFASAQGMVRPIG